MFDEYFESTDFLKHKFYQVNRRQIIFSIDGKIKSKEGTSQKKKMKLRNVLISIS